MLSAVLVPVLATFEILVAPLLPCNSNAAEQFGPDAPAPSTRVLTYDDTSLASVWVVNMSLFATQLAVFFIARWSNKRRFSKLHSRAVHVGEVLGSSSPTPMAVGDSVVVHNPMQATSPQSPRSASPGRRTSVFLKSFDATRSRAQHWEEEFKHLALVVVTTTMLAVATAQQTLPAAAARRGAGGCETWTSA